MKKPTGRYQGDPQAIDLFGTYELSSSAIVAIESKYIDKIADGKYALLTPEEKEIIARQYHFSEALITALNKEENTSIKVTPSIQKLDEKLLAFLKSVEELSKEEVVEAAQNLLPNYKDLKTAQAEYQKISKELDALSKEAIKEIKRNFSLITDNYQSLNFLSKQIIDLNQDSFLSKSFGEKFQIENSSQEQISTQILFLETKKEQIVSFLERAKTSNLLNKNNFKTFEEIGQKLNLAIEHLKKSLETINLINEEKANDPNYKYKRIIGRVLRTPEKVEQYRNHLAFKEKYSNLQLQLEDNRQKISDAEQETQGNDEEVEGIIKQIGYLKERMRFLNKRNSDLSLEMREHKKGEEVLQSSIQVLEKSRNFHPLFEKGKITTLKVEITSENKATESEVEEENEEITRDSEKVFSIYKEKIEDFISKNQSKIWENFSAQEITEIILAGIESNGFSEKEQNLIWSYFLLHEGNIGKMMKSFDFKENLKNFFLNYFPNSENTSQEIEEQTEVAKEENNYLPKVLESLKNKKIAFVAHSNGSRQAKKMEYMAEIINEKAEGNFLHVDVSDIDKVRSLFENGEIDLAVIHYSFSRPGEISKLRNVCAQNTKSGYDKIPFLLIPYQTGPQQSLIFIAERIGCINKISSL